VDHLKDGKVDVALDELRQAAALSPEYPEVQFQLALALQKKGVPPGEVANAFTKAIELKPASSAAAHLQLGLVLKQMGRTAEALAEIKRATGLAPSLVEAHRVLGEAALESGDWSGARAEFGAILAWNAEDQGARRALSLARAHYRRQ